ncbi:MAG: YlxR family protein [Clostridia bacterium]
MTKIRTCSLCKKKYIKNELFRIVSINKSAVLDEKQNINSRGMYICRNKKCIENFLRVIEKSKYNLKIDVNLDSLKNVLELLLNRMGE